MNISGYEGAAAGRSDLPDAVTLYPRNLPVFSFRFNRVEQRPHTSHQVRAAPAGKCGAVLCDDVSAQIADSPSYTLAQPDLTSRVADGSPPLGPARWPRELPGRLRLLLHLAGQVWMQVAAAMKLSARTPPLGIPR